MDEAQRRHEHFQDEHVTTLHPNYMGVFWWLLALTISEIAVDADARPAVLDEPDHHREAVVAADEVLRAVDRIDEPEPARAERAGRRRQLFGDDRIAVERRGETGDDQLRREAIGDRHRLVAGLHLDAECTVAAYAHDLVAGAQCQLERGV